MGGAGVISVASHVVGDEMRRIADEPDRRAEIDASLRDVYDVLFSVPNPVGVKTALQLLGRPVGGVRLPHVEANRPETATIRTVLERHGLLAATGSSAATA